MWGTSMTVNSWLTGTCQFTDRLTEPEAGADGTHLRSENSVMF
jgi:hypothetical protein